jgi:Sec-independent protein translocase protein TatA
MSISITQLILVIIVGILLFGNLPKLFKDVGTGIVSFKKIINSKTTLSNTDIESANTSANASVNARLQQSVSKEEASPTGQPDGRPNGQTPPKLESSQTAEGVKLENQEKRDAPQ